LSSTDADGTNTTATVNNSPIEDDNCLFEYNSSTKALTITRCNQVKNGNHIYFDNSVSNFTGNIYLVIGHDKPTAYSKVYQLTQVTGTKLYHIDFNTDTWSDVTYYAIIASSSNASTLNGDNKWGSSSLSTKGNNGYTAIYTSKYDFDGTSGSYKTFLITTAAAGNDKDMTIDYYDDYSKLPKPNATQAAKKRDTGTTYSAITGSNAWPATLKLEGSYMKNATDTARSTITSTTSGDGDGSKTYGVIKTGTVTQSYTSLNAGYHFEGWGTGDTPSNTDASYSYNITAATTVYAFFSKLYTLTYAVKGDYSTSTVTCYSVDGYSGSKTSVSSIPTGHLITIVASPATGYEVKGWYSDASCTSAYTSGSGDVTIESGNNTFKLASLNADTEVYPKFGPKTYTITLEDMVPTTAGQGSVTVTFNASTNMTSAVTKPTKNGYTFDGYWTDNDDSGATLVTQLIDANGYWKKDISTYTGHDGSDNPTWIYPNGKSLFAKWTEDKHTVSVAVSPAGAGSVQVNSSNVSTVTGVGIATKSAEMTPVAANALWKFKEWQATSNVQMDDVNYRTDYQQGSDNKMKINATDDDQTITAVFEPRYYFVGGEIMSGDDAIGTGTSSGMPGWDNYDDPFIVQSASLATCSLTLGHDKNYFIMVSDKADGLSYGKADTHLGDNTSVVFDTQDAKVTFQSNGGDNYTFKITAVNGSGRPTVSVERPYQVNLGWQYKTLDADATSGNTGGTAAMSKTVGGDAVANGVWVPYGTGVTYTASPTTGYSVAWYSSSDYSGDPFTTDAVFYHTATSTGNGYAKFTEKTTTVSLENDGHGKVQIGGVDKISTTCGVTTTRSLTAVPNDGYAFKDWSKPSGDDITLSSTTTNPTTLTGVGAGLSEGQRVYASFSEIARTITASAGTGGTVGAASYTAYIDTKADISATPDIGYKFKEWQETGGTSKVTFDDVHSASTKIKATGDATIQAVFEPRWSVAGSWKTYPESAAWDADTYKLSNIGTNGSSKDTCYVEITLPANTNLTFKIVDRGADGTVAVGSYVDYGNNTTATQYMKYNNHTNWGFGLKSSGYYDCGITTTGGGTYKFAFNITDKSLTVTYQTSYQSNFGWKYADGSGTLHDGDNGGTITVTASDGGSHTISSGDWVAAGASITYLASPAAGYAFGGWHNNSDCSTGKFNDNLSWEDGPLAATSNSYAKFVPVAVTFTNNSGSGDGKWGTASNWSPACVPTIDHDVVITKPVTVDIAHATAKSIVLDQNSKTGKLTIEANKGLEIVGTITRTTDGSSYSATGEADLVLESNEDGNASLIFNNSNSCAATVQMYSKATISGSTWNWQYVGTPFAGSIPQYNYYGSWMYKWNGTTQGWDVVGGYDELTPFAGYCLTQNSATTHVMGGTLVATDGNDQVITMSATTDMVLANSWTAPIWIGGFTASTFTSTPATIYMFNTGMAEKGSKAGTAEAGTYEAKPINSAPFIGNGLIAPMQGFFVTTVDGSAGTITLKYNELVRPHNNRQGDPDGIVSGPMFVQKREVKPDVMKIMANGTLYSDHVFILAREDFSEGFDNGWDGEKLSFGAEAPSVYVINQKGGYDAVSAIPGFEGTLVGFRAGTNNSCTMTFEYDGEEIWYLNDLQTQQSTLIDSELTYTFSTSSYDNEARFIISATPIRKITTGVETVTGYGLQGTGVRKLIINDKIYIIRGGRMFTVDGQMVK
jgi:hypothetical protein